MNNMSALQDALYGVVPDASFLLDERTVLSRLKAIEEYASLVPYMSDESAKDNTNLSWSDYLFMGGNTPERLAEIYQTPSTADGHLLPHQAFLLAILTLLETPRAFLNYFPSAHRDMYYRQLLALQERTSEPSQVAVSIALDKDTSEWMVPKGTLLDAGRDSQGNSIEFGLDDALLVNHSEWQDLRWCYPNFEGSGAGTSAIVYGEQHAWPANGIRLFDPVKQNQAILTGRMLASSCLVNESSQDLVVTISFETRPVTTGLFADCSSGEQWLPLMLEGGNDNSVTLTFPAGRGEIGEPDGLPGVAFKLPVIRLSRQDGQSVPAIVSVTVGARELENHQYQTAIMTPFGHSDEEQPVKSMQLYFGVGELQAGQTLSLFWKINTALPLDVSWQYLAQDNRWLDLDPYLVDRTQGLLRSERWSAIVPANASNVASAMPAGRYWFRAEIVPVTAQEPSVTKYPWLNGLLTNGMTATLKNVTALDSAVVATALPAGTIRRLVKNMSSVSRIQQPWASWGGRPAESTETFSSRVAQRLAHRHRAVTWPDMVMLLKTTFPDVFEVMTPSGKILTSVPALTEQTLVVIPKMIANDNNDALRPLFNAAKLDAMRDMLQSLASPWQGIQVKNPRYRDVQLEYDVVFRTGVNPMWAERELQNAIIARYMPWSTGAATGVSLANRIDYYDVMAALQQQPYVDHVSSLTLDGLYNSAQGDDDEVLILCWPNEFTATRSV